MRPAITASKTDNQRVTLISNNQNENFALLISELLYVAAAENYCDVFYVTRDVLHKKTLRIGISAIENQLNAVDATFFRCHKSFIVNRAHVSKVSGNAQGYKLNLKQTEITIPVSRKWNHSLREELAIRQ
jgi:DNA-binding LytR/AlgR family response regulator